MKKKINQSDLKGTYPTNLTITFGHTKSYKTDIKIKIKAEEYLDDKFR